MLAHVENEKRGHCARFRIDRAKTLALYTEGTQLELDLADEYRVYLAKLHPDARPGDHWGTDGAGIGR